MKKFLCLIAFTAFIGYFESECGADFPTKVGGQTFPGKYSQPVLVGPFISSVTCANVSTGGQEVRISSYTSMLHTVTISSAGLGSPLVQLFDSYYSTGQGSGATGSATSSSTPTVRALISPIDARGVAVSSTSLAPSIINFTPFTLSYDVEAASGITLRNYADSVAPCVTVTYTFKQ